jgi:phosphoribosylformylglycinamidine synthase PurS subunit
VKLRFEVIVVLKDGLLDPQGKAVHDALPTLGWTNVSDVRIGKSIFLTVDSDDPAAAEQQVNEMAVRFLSNPVIERFWVRQLASEDAS